MLVFARFVVLARSVQASDFVFIVPISRQTISRP